MARLRNGRGHARKPVQHQKQSVSITLDGDISEQLRSFLDDVVDQACRPAAFAGATVLYNEMKLRVPQRTGELKDSIYRYRDRADDKQEKSTFYVGPNKRKAPHWYLIEFGHFQHYKVYLDQETKQWVTLKDSPLATPRFIPAQPYIRPTFDSKVDEALQVAKNELQSRLRQLMADKGLALY